MDIQHTLIEGIAIVRPRIFNDPRGYFLESWNHIRYAESGIDADFIQDNESKSRYGVLRGLHFQAPPYSQAKLVRVITGRVLDVVLDIRRDSPTFGKHHAIELSGENKQQLYIPRGFAHGFAVLSDEVIFAYKCDNVYMPSHERGIAFDDPALAIDWRLPAADLILSDRDRTHLRLSEIETFTAREFAAGLKP
ncbi:MAG: dTDP-4-dehydrorhamnose 3,5-epimerase [Victivallaceae bacterium]